MRGERGAPVQVGNLVEIERFFYHAPGTTAGGFGRLETWLGTVEEIRESSGVAVVVIRHTNGETSARGVGEVRRIDVIDAMVRLDE